MGEGMPRPKKLAEIQKERILSQADLVREGADVTAEGEVIATGVQKADAKYEMEDDIRNKKRRDEIHESKKGRETISLESTEANGVTINLLANRETDKYEIQFSGSGDTDGGYVSPKIELGEEIASAKDIYHLSRKLAEKGHPGKNISRLSAQEMYEEVYEHVESLRESEGSD
ncbi:hypothetical protein EXS57_01970 [Candidatus Kaiserbacteria bacterium]|nr:hypothetical protein [Candidatus Kaiserbacteria bacterium]